MRAPSTGTLHQACDELFDRYPLAANTATSRVSTMVLLVRDGDEPRYFILGRQHEEGKPFYWLRPWRSVDTEFVIGDDEPVPQEAAWAITEGTPLPGHGSLFGWTDRGNVTALIVVSPQYSPEYPESTYSVLPQAGIAQHQWPPFTGEHLFGPWFWEHCEAGRIISLAGAIAGTRKSVWWVEPPELPEYGGCVVSRDVLCEDGSTLPRGCYLFCEVLAGGYHVPSVADLLTTSGKTDLGPRFSGRAAR